MAGEIVTAAMMNAHVRDNFNAILIPVGSLYTNADVATNPATLLGYGTWAAFGAGRVLVAIDSGQTEFDVLGETGGAKTHTLTTAEMPAHAHNMNTFGAQSGSGGGIDVLNNAGSNYSAGSPFPYMANAGGGGAHNNLQPYVVVHMWRRTA